MHAALESLVGHLVPERIAEGDPDTARQGRLIIYFCLIILTAGLIYATAYAALGMPISALGSALAFLFSAGIALWFRNAGNIPGAAHLLGFTCALGLILVTSGTGGVSSPANAWFILCPIIPSMIAGRQAGLPWVGVSLGWFTLSYGLHFAGIELPNELPSQSLVALNDYIVPFGLTLCLFAIAWSYEVAKDEALERIRKIGTALERSRDEAKAAHRSARVLLDTINEGLLLVQPDGTLEAEHSAAVHDLIGAPGEDAKLWSLFEASEPQFAEWLSIAWEDLEAGWMPLDVIFDQLPRRTLVRDRHLALRYRPVVEDGALKLVLVILSDVTHEVHAQRAEDAQKEVMAVFIKVMQDMPAVLEFMAEARTLVARIVEGEGDAVQDRRWIHTLKGNCSMFGIHGMARWLHELEDRMVDQEGTCRPSDRVELRERWAELEDRLAPVLQRRREDKVIIDRSALDAAAAAAESSGITTLARTMRRWTWQRVDHHLERLSTRARDLAERLGKSHTRVRVEADDIRQPPNPAWSAFWGSLVHVVRNALDHGIEEDTRRLELGKEPQAELLLSARSDDGDLVVEIRDDGRGIDWEALSEAARHRGLPVETHEDRIAALFADGLSTRQDVTELSGRGVGAGAVWAACVELGGRVEVESTPGRGTCFRFRVPDQGSKRALAS